MSIELTEATIRSSKLTLGYTYVFNVKNMFIKWYLNMTGIFVHLHHAIVSSTGILHMEEPLVSNAYFNCILEHKSELVYNKSRHGSTIALSCK